MQPPRTTGATASSPAFTHSPYGVRVSPSLPATAPSGASSGGSPTVADAYASPPTSLDPTSFPLGAPQLSHPPPQLTSPQGRGNGHHGRRGQHHAPHLSGTPQQFPFQGYNGSFGGQPFVPSPLNSPSGGGSMHRSTGSIDATGYTLPLAVANQPYGPPLISNASFGQPPPLQRSGSNRSLHSPPTPPAAGAPTIAAPGFPAHPAASSYVPQGFSQQVAPYQHGLQRHHSGESFGSREGSQLNRSMEGVSVGDHPSSIEALQPLQQTHRREVNGALYHAGSGARDFFSTAATSGSVPTSSTATEIEERESLVSGSSSSSIRDDLPLCENDSGCTLINDKRHQRQCAHTCRLFPCYHAHVKRHAKLFRHAPGQLVVTPAPAEAAAAAGGKPSKQSQKASLALTSVNFQHISADAPNATKLTVSSKDKCYDIFGDWTLVKVHTFKRYLHQVFGVVPVQQRLFFGEISMNDDLATVASCGVCSQPAAVITLRTDDDDTPPHPAGAGLRFDVNEL